MTPEAAEYYRALAPAGDWIAILPELALGVLALLLLVAELLLPQSRKGLINGIALIPQALLAIWVGLSAVNYAPGAASAPFNGLLVQNGATELMRFFFLLTSALVGYLGVITFKKQKLPVTEFHVLVLIGTAGMMFLAQANDFLMLFVALEMLAISLYVLVAYIRHSPLSLEAGLKYLIMSGLSSALLLFGIVLLYGAAGNPLLPGSTGDPLRFDLLRTFVLQNPDNAYVISGAVFVVSSLLFKIAAVPFQIWVSDVYQGAPTPVTAYLSVASKAAGFVVMLNLLTGIGPLAPLAPVLLPILSAVAILTILFGNLAAVGQRNVKRMMGLSGIAHAGYLLLGVCAAFTIPWARSAIYFYLFMYLLASFAVFAVMAHVSGKDDAVQELDDYSRLFRRSPFLGGVLIIGLGSLAGIPPLAGFIAKVLLFVAAYQAGLYSLLGVAILGVIISIYYYFGWMREASFVPSFADAESDADDKPITEPTFLPRTIMATLCILSIGFGFWQGFLSL